MNVIQVVRHIVRLRKTDNRGSGGHPQGPWRGNGELVLVNALFWLTKGGRFWKCFRFCNNISGLNAAGGTKYGQTAAFDVMYILTTIVYVCLTCMGAGHEHAIVHMQSEGNLGCQPLPPTFLETGSLLISAWLPNVQGLLCPPQLYLGLGDVNSVLLVWQVLCIPSHLRAPILPPFKKPKTREEREEGKEGEGEERRNWKLACLRSETQGEGSRGEEKEGLGVSSLSAIHGYKPVFMSA